MATIPLEDLGVELALAVSGPVQVPDAARGSYQSALVIAIALGTALSPADSNQRV
jgi:hypothetical protein